MGTNGVGRPVRQTVDGPDEWVVIAGAQKAADAKAAALDHLAAMGFKLHPEPGRSSFGVIGITDDQIRMDMFCGRQPTDGWTRISVRRSALEAARPDLGAGGKTGPV